MSLTVLGVSADCRLSDVASDVVANAPLAVGSAANLALAGVPAATERIELGPLAPALDRLRTAPAGTVVVASGDPGFFGILRALTEAGLPCRVIPSVSSVAAAFARAGLGWDGAVVVSAHGRALAPAVNACRALPRVAVLTGPGAGPVHLARALAGWPRELVVAERLGLSGERVRRFAAEEVAAADDADFADPNVVLCLATDSGPSSAPDDDAGSQPRWHNQPAAAPAAGWALPETAYRHRDSMITKAEVRAYAVARLRPGLGRLVLDLGAGSGSVGIECARLGAAVICLDSDPLACDTVAANARTHGAEVRVVPGRAEQVLGTLPDADAAFVGGGGLDTVRAVIGRRIPTVVAAFAALDRALAARTLLAEAGYSVEGSQLAASRLAELPGGGVRLTALNPVLVLTAELDPNGLDPSGLDPSGLDPSSLDPNGLNPSGLDPSGARS